MRVIIFIFLLIIFISLACQKTNEDPVFDLIPKIDLLTVSTNEVIEFRDTLIIEIKYEDGDGDLGNANPDINSIFVKDARLSQADEYYLGPLAPEDAQISITGTLELRLSPTFIFGNGTSESTTFDIFVKDRMGNESNVITTESIMIVRE